MFYNKFCFIISCSVIKVIIEEPSCTGSSESIQVFKHFYLLSSQSSLYKADESKVLDSLVVAVVFLISGIIFSVSVSGIISGICIFSILSMCRLKCGDQNSTACSRCWRTRDLYNGRISSLFLYLKLRAMYSSTLLVVLQLFSVCFCRFMS